ncbi:tyrosine-type recombinase/integrase [Dermabacteraceae bacterium P7006]
MRDTKHTQIKAYDTRNGTRYLVRYRQPNGKQTMKRGFRTIKDAQDFLVETEAAKRTGGYVKPSAGRTPVSEVVEELLEIKKVTVRPSTLKILKSIAKNHVLPDWGNIQVSKVTEKDLQKWVNQKMENFSASRIRNVCAFFSQVLDLAVKRKCIVKNPFREVELPKYKPQLQRRYLSHLEVKRIAEASKHPLLVYVLSYCGIRWGEAMALRPRDINLLRGRITVERTVQRLNYAWHYGPPKNGNPRQVPFPKFIGPMLEQRMNECASLDELLFAGEKGTPLSGNVFWWCSALRRTGIERLRLHDLRHTAASLAVQSGASVKVVQTMLGHSSAALTLDTYADLFDSDLDDVAVRMGDAREIAIRQAK